MNLKELVQEINSALDYNPDIKAYTDQVIRVINRHYLQVSGQYPWKFLQKTDDIILRPDIKGSLDNRLRVYETGGRNVSRRVYPVGADRCVITKDMEGQTLILDVESYEQSEATAPSGSDYKAVIEGAGGYGQEFLITRATLGNRSDSHNLTYSGKEPNYATVGGSSVDTDTTIGRLSDDTVAKGIVEPSPYYNSAGYDSSGTDSNQYTYIVLDSEMSQELFAAVNDADVTAGVRTLDDQTITTEWKIEYRRFPLPKDCTEVLSIMDRGLTVPAHSVTGTGDDKATTTKKTSPDKGRLVFLDSKKEEYLFLDRDSSGDPVVAIEDEWMHLEPPSRAPCLEQSAGASIGIKGYFEPGATYQYCYTFLYAGGESPPSPVAEITTNNGNPGTYAIKVFGLEDTSCATGNDGETGRIKRLYRRMLPKESDGKYGKGGGTHHRTSTGPWLHVEDLSEVGGTERDDGELGIESTFDDRIFYDQGSTHGISFSKGDPATGAPDSAIVGTKYTYHGGDKFKLIRLDEHGPRQWIRVYRPPSGDMKVQVRYLSRPRRMVADNDYPNWPPQYHHLLVYLSLADICLQHGMATQGQLYERKAEQLLDRMRQKYLSSPARQYIRRGFDSRTSSGERWGTPTKL